MIIRNRFLRLEVINEKKLLQMFRVNVLRSSYYVTQCLSRTKTLLYMDTFMYLSLLRKLFFIRHY